MVNKFYLFLLCVITASFGIFVGQLIPSIDIYNLGIPYYITNLFGSNKITPTVLSTIPCTYDFSYNPIEDQSSDKHSSVARYRDDDTAISVNAEALAALQLARLQIKKIIETNPPPPPPPADNHPPLPPPAPRHQPLPTTTKDKTLRLYKHALALAPAHADILNEYGEYLEKHRFDLISAETLYCRAVAAAPSHRRALENRRRTLPLVMELDRRDRRRIDDKRAHIMAIPAQHAGLRRMKRESYFSHIYHAVAIEGNTFTLSETRSLVETRMAVAGKSLTEHNEILGLEAALKYVNATLLHRIGELTVDDVLAIHRRVLGYVDPIGAGFLRTTQVFVGSHVPPPASEIPRLMDEFIDWLNDRDTLRLHPIELAALSHYRLVALHPFYDGNGRTCRLLMNFILMQAGFPPVTVKKQQKQEYYECLEQANNGDVRPFIRFIARCTERTLDEYLWATEEESKLAELFPDAEKTIMTAGKINYP